MADVCYNHFGPTWIQQRYPNGNNTQTKQNIKNCLKPVIKVITIAVNDNINFDYKKIKILCWLLKKLTHNEHLMKSTLFVILLFWLIHLKQYCQFKHELSYDLEFWLIHFQFFSNYFCNFDWFCDCDNHLFWLIHLQAETSVFEFVIFCYSDMPNKFSFDILLFRIVLLSLLESH